MLRRVCCGDCVQPWQDAVGKYPGEYVKIVEGTLHVDCRCDGCNKPLVNGVAANCVSVSTNRTPYFAWEHEFIVAKG